MRALSLKRLASRAEVGGSAAEDDSLDRGFAAATGLAFSRIHLMAVLEFSGFAVDVNIIAERGAAMADGLTQNEFDGFGQGRGSVNGDFVGGGEGVNARVMEGLVNIYV